MMRLFIAEKPSLARAIAAVLPLPHEKKGSAIYCGPSDVVTWCAGHIMALSTPDAYGDDYAKWSLGHLPIVPKVWQREVKMPELFNTIKGLLPKATTVVHAGDPDREGQLLIDEVLAALAYQGSVLRLLIQDLNPAAVIKALADLKPNSDFRGLSQSAEARAKADWLYGLNMTRLYTLLGRLGGYQAVLSVGRVQTPLLGLIVRRDLMIEAFKPAEHFALTATLTKENIRFIATWRPGEQHVNEHGLMQNLSFMEDLSKRLAGQSAKVSSVQEKEIDEASPLPYDLASLQIDAAKTLGLGAKETLDICQALYETHRLITYPRSDCAYLPEGHLHDVPEVIKAIKTHTSSLSPLLDKADTSLRSRAWDDNKITAHHAIIPTTKTNASALSQEELGVYTLIARRYIAQCYPKASDITTRIVFDIDGETFEATGRRVIATGWREVYQTAIAPHAQDDLDEAPTSPIPKLQSGEALPVAELVVKAKKTQPPPRFNDASLIKAMSNISAFVDDTYIKKILKETDGLGTPATQAAMIQTLFDRHYVEKRGKHIIATPTGRALIAILPSIATTPDLTALWESRLHAIAKGEITQDAFLLDITAKLGELMQSGKAGGRLNIPGVTLHPCPTCNHALMKCESKQKNGHYWRCSQQGCTQALLSDIDGVPTPKQTVPCPTKGCGGLLVRRTSKQGGHWWCCNHYAQGCQTTADDEQGMPVIKEYIPCPQDACTGALTRHKSKKGDGYWWGCSAYKTGCKVTMQDDNGQPRWQVDT